MENQFSKMLLVLLLGTLYGCAVVPKSYPDTTSTCDLKTNRWELTVQNQSNFCIQNNTRQNNTRQIPIDCLLTLSIPVLSAVISSSIVLAGNTIHWIEKQGDCRPDEIEKEVATMKHLIEEEIIQPREDDLNSEMQVKKK